MQSLCSTSKCVGHLGMVTTAIQHLPLAGEPRNKRPLFHGSLYNESLSDLSTLWFCVSQGHLYLFDGYLCFYCNLFSVTKLVWLPLKTLRWTVAKDWPTTCKVLIVERRLLWPPWISLRCIALLEGRCSAHFFFLRTASTALVLKTVFVSISSPSLVQKLQGLLTS